MSWRAAHSGNEAWKFLHLNKIRTYQQVPDLSWLQQIQSWDLLLKITWHQKLPKLARKLQEATSVYGSTSHEGPQRGLCLSALIKSIPFSLFSFFLVLNWKLSFSSANDCNKMMNALHCWRAHRSGTWQLWVLLSLCWLSTSHSLGPLNGPS